MNRAIFVCVSWLVPALVTWLLVFRFLPFARRAYRAATEGGRDAEDATERTMLKAVTLRERHDILRDALATLVAMRRRSPDGVGNWDWAFDRAEKALALADAPLVGPRIH